jgi:shikimate dehydrogenase
MSTDRYAVIGHPVDHSRSPEIHLAFARATDDDIRYERLDPGPEGFDKGVTGFFASGGQGLNVTVPFKETAFEWCDRAGEAASRAGVVNTLTVDAAEGVILGDNTDGIGLVRDLGDNRGVTLADARVLILGAGGAARGVVGPLLDAGPATLAVANRTERRAHLLAGDLWDASPIQGLSLDELADEAAFDIVINATAAGLGGSAPPVPADVLAAGGVAYDLVYGDKAGPFLAWAREAGAGTATDGLGMLVEQAAESYRIWRGVQPDTRSVLAAMRGGETP